jgi:hypothetical protein
MQHKKWTEKMQQARSADVRDGKRFNRYAAPRRRMEELWALICGKPLKFPERKRRKDREWPKAA